MVGAEAKTEVETQPPHRQAEAGTQRERDRHRGVPQGGQRAGHRHLPWERSWAGQGSGLKLPTAAGAPIGSGVRLSAEKSRVCVGRAWDEASLGQ